MALTEIVVKECPNCGTEVKPGWVACPVCTVNLEEAARRLGREYFVPAREGSVSRYGWYCPRCSTQMAADAPFCYHCGESRTADNPSQRSGSSTPKSIPAGTPVSVPAIAIVIFFATILIAVSFGSWDAYFSLFVVAALVSLYLLYQGDSSKVPIIKALGVIICVFGLLMLAYAAYLYPVAIETNNSDLADWVIETGLIDPIAHAGVQMRWAEFLEAQSYARGVVLNSLPIFLFGLVIFIRVEKK